MDTTLRAAGAPATGPHALTIEKCAIFPACA